MIGSCLVALFRDFFSLNIKTSITASASLFSLLFVLPSADDDDDWDHLAYVCPCIGVWGKFVLYFIGDKLNEVKLVLDKRQIFTH